MSGQPERVERCDVCGFDAAEWNDLDTINTIRHAPEFLRNWSVLLTDEQTHERTQSDVWSVNEYVDHVREVLFGMRFVIDLALDDPGTDLGEMPEPQPAGDRRTFDRQASIDAVTCESDALVAALRRLGDDEWNHGVAFSGELHTVTWASRHAVHDLMHHLGDIASIANDLGVGAAAQRGVVTHVNASNGGVPKIAVPSADVGRNGVVGDVQGSRVHHGRPWQALCLWSADVIADLVAEGHPIFAGAAGENITVSGIDWATMHAGVVLTIGDMTCQISAPATPCSKNKRWFADGDSKRIADDRHPARTRWYASVLTPGRISAGDEVVCSGTARRPVTTS